MKSTRISFPHEIELLEGQRVRIISREDYIRAVVCNVVGSLEDVGNFISWCNEGRDMIQDVRDRQVDFQRKAIEFLKIVD